MNKKDFDQIASISTTGPYDYELVADTDEIIGKIHLFFTENKNCKATFPTATIKIVPHEGRPGSSIYGNSNWKFNNAMGISQLRVFLEGIHAVIKTL